MENQHRLIKTYRELSQTEIDLMNECKILEARYHQLHDKIHSHIQTQFSDADEAEDNTECTRIILAAPSRWLSISKTNVEQGFMAMVRAVAQPSTPQLEAPTEVPDEVQAP